MNLVLKTGPCVWIIVTVQRKLIAFFRSVGWRRLWRRLCFIVRALLLIISYNHKFTTHNGHNKPTF